MTKARRIAYTMTGLFMILLALSMILDAETVYPIVIIILGFSLFLSGIRSLIYFFSMARLMVGGRAALYRAVIILDMGLFTLSLTNVPLYCVVIYLAGLHGFSGVIDILRSVEARKLQAPSWKLNLSQGIINVIIALLCLVFIGTVEVAVAVYAAGLAYAGLIRIIQAFRRKSVTYGGAEYYNSPAV